MTEIQVSTKDEPGDYDAYETAKPDEPIFTVQGGDPLGPLTVMFWCWKARQLARRQDDDKARQRMLRKAGAAEEVAWAMKEYQSGELGAVNPAEVRVTFTDTAPKDDAHKWKSPVISAARHLREAEAALIAAAEHLPEDQARAIRDRAQLIGRIATEYQPKRASFGNDPDFPTAPLVQGAAA